MWDALRAKGLDLEPAVSLKPNVYLGCAQREIEADMDLVFAKRERMSRLCDTGGSGKPDSTNIPELKEPSDEPAPKPKRNKKKAGQTPTPLIRLQASKSRMQNPHAQGNLLSRPGLMRCSAM